MFVCIQMHVCLSTHEHARARGYVCVLVLSVGLLPTCISVWMYVCVCNNCLCPSVFCPSINQFNVLYVSMSSCLSMQTANICLFVCLPVCPKICLFVCLSAYLFVCLTVCRPHLQIAGYKPLLHKTMGWRTPSISSYMDWSYSQTSSRCYHRSDRSL